MLSTRFDWFAVYRIKNEDTEQVGG